MGEGTWEYSGCFTLGRFPCQPPCGGAPPRHRKGWPGDGVQPPGWPDAKVHVGIMSGAHQHHQVCPPWAPVCTQPPWVVHQPHNPSVGTDSGHGICWNILRIQLFVPNNAAGGYTGQLQVVGRHQQARLGPGLPRNHHQPHSYPPTSPPAALYLGYISAVSAAVSQNGANNARPIHGPNMYGSFPPWRAFQMHVHPLNSHDKAPLSSTMPLRSTTQSRLYLVCISV